MATESLSGAADFAHLDGALIMPIFLDDYHFLVTQDGAMLMMPAGVQIHSAGRFSIDAQGPHIDDTHLTEEDCARLKDWAYKLVQPHVQDFFRAQIATTLESYPDPDRFINPYRPLIPTEGE
jgi:hypothetical protein